MAADPLQAHTNSAVATSETDGGVAGAAAPLGNDTAISSGATGPATDSIIADPSDTTGLPVDTHNGSGGTSGNIVVVASNAADMLGSNDASAVEAENFDEDFDDNQDDSLDDNYDFTTNTPLLWAAGKGYLRPVWLFLQDGYSSNDLDSLGNNALHLAAANGNLKVVKSLIEDGANANFVNMYKNLPIDMAMSKEVRDIISVAMVKNASMTTEDTIIMHRANLRMVSARISSEYCLAVIIFYFLSFLLYCTCSIRTS